MLSSLTLRTIRTSTAQSALRHTVPRAAAASYPAHFSSMGEKLKHKEKVEEDRYMRQLEKEFIEKKRTEMAASMKAQEVEYFENTVAPVMAEIDALLKTSGNNSISHKGLEDLARWKLGK